MTKHDPSAAIEVSKLTKRYGDLTAVDNVTFSVAEGEIFAYLGPNGAGKTTTISILCGLLPRDAGTTAVCGVDIDQDPVAVKQRIGVVPENSNLYPELTCRRNLEYLGELYGLARPARRTRTDELLGTLGLADKSDTPFRSLSRGMKRRLTVAAALVHSPEIVLLDEPTAGLDVPSARALRETIKAINRDGTTVFLTTHNLSEAEVLSDRVLILVKGQVVAEGTAAEIRQRVEKARTVRVTFSGDVAGEALRAVCPAVRSASCASGTWQLEVTDTHAAVAQIISLAEKQHLKIAEVSTAGVSLEDAFMTILEDRSRRPEARE